MSKLKIDSPLKLSYYKGNIVAVIQYNRKTFRYNLAKVPADCFLEKSVMLKNTAKFSEAKELAEIISTKTKQLKPVIDEILMTIGPHETLKKEVIDRRLMLAFPQNSNVEVAQTERNAFTVDFGTWLNEGKGSKRKRITKKDFISAYHFLLDFEYDNGKFTIDEFNDDLLHDIIEYAYEPHENTDDHKYYSKGNLANRTLNKRLDSIWTFISEFYKIDPKSIVDLRHLTVIDKKIIRLTREELHQLEVLDIQDPELDRTRDYFLFLCYTGLRFGDFAKLNRTYVDTETNELVLLTNKTQKPCRIYLFDKAKEIGEKYNYHFAPVYNQVLNRQIKQLCREYDLFQEEITIDYMAKTRETETKKKRDLIGCHTGRRTYISMLVELGMDIYDIMSATGHTTIQMVQKYIDLFGKSRRNKFEEVNKKIRIEL